MVKDIKCQGSPYTWLVVLNDEEGEVKKAEAAVLKQDPKALKVFSAKHNSYCLFMTKDLPETLAA